jgi:hypothetical protein
MGAEGGCGHVKSALNIPELTRTNHWKPSNGTPHPKISIFIDINPITSLF